MKDFKNSLNHNIKKTKEKNKRLQNEIDELEKKINLVNKMNNLYKERIKLKNEINKTNLQIKKIKLDNSRKNKRIRKSYNGKDLKKVVKELYENNKNIFNKENMKVFLYRNDWECLLCNKIYKFDKYGNVSGFVKQHMVYEHPEEWNSLCKGVVPNNMLNLK